MKINKLFSLWLTTLILLFSGCEKDYFDPDIFKKNFIIQDIPAGFDWSTLTELQVTVIPQDRYNGQYYYKIEIYDRFPAAGGNAQLYAGGVCREGAPFETTFTVPQGLTALFIRQTDPTGHVSVRSYPVLTEELVCDFNAIASSAPQTSSAPSLLQQAANPTRVQFPTPEDAIEITSTTPSPFRLLTNHAYVIRNTYQGELRFPGEGNTALYVEGIWQNTGSGSTSLEKGTWIIVQSGGEIQVKSPLWNITAINSSILAIAEKAQFNTAGTPVNLLFTNNSGKLLNEGLCRVQEVTMNSGAEFYNRGELETRHFICHTVNQMINDGKYQTTDLSINGSYFINNGTFLASNKITAGGATIINNGSFTAQVFDCLETTQVDNHCRLTVNETLRLKQATLNSASLTSVTSQTLFSSYSRINLDGLSVLEVKGEATFDYAQSILRGSSPEGTFALARIGKVILSGWKCVLYQGNLEVECNDHMKSPDIYNPWYEYTAPAQWVSESMLQIPAGECTGAGNQPTPEEPGNPDFPVEVPQGAVQTWILEDMFPQSGDYDMNDLVTDVQLTYLQNGRNQVKQLNMHLTLRAVGGTRRMAAAIQLEKIAKSNIQSIIYRTNANRGDGSFFHTDTRGLENGQTKPVIPLFENAHHFMGVSHTSTLVNTFASGKGYTAPDQSIDLSVQFRQPVDISAVSIKNLNFFAITGNISEQRTEVHLPGFPHTDKSNISASIAESTAPLMWGLIIPVSFQYAAEAIDIRKAYPEFENWVTSGGTNNRNWYLHPSKIQEYIYQTPLYD